MRSAVALLSLLLASAQAFYMPAQTRSPAVRPSFLGQRVATRQAAVARPNHLRASLEDIEKKLAEMEKAATAGLKGSSPTPKIPTKFMPPLPPTPKASVPKVQAPKVQASKAAASKLAAPSLPPVPEAIKKAVAPSPSPSSGLPTDELAEGFALGALPWVVAPVLALAALRPLLAAGAEAREKERKAKAEAEEKARKAEALAAASGGLSEADQGALKAVAAIAAVCLGGLLVQPLLAPPDLPSPAAVVQQAKKVAPPAPAPKTEPVPAPAPAPKPEPAPAPAPAPKREPAAAPAPAPKPEPAPAPAPAPKPEPAAVLPPKTEPAAPAPEPKLQPRDPAEVATAPKSELPKVASEAGERPAPPAPKAAPKKAPKDEAAASTYSGPKGGRVLEAETLDPDVLKMLKSPKKY